MSIHVLDTTDEKPHFSLFRVKLTHPPTHGMTFIRYDWSDKR